MKTLQAVQSDKSEPKVYGTIDLFMGPGDDYSFQGIALMYDSIQKVQYVEWLSKESGVSKSLFDRDLAPKCHEIIGKIKDKYGKLSYDTIYIVNETGAEKISA